MSDTLDPSSHAQSVLDRLVIAGVASAVLVLLWYLITFVREMASPNEPYATSIGLTLPGCINTVRNSPSVDEARAYCHRPAPKRF